MVNNVNHNNRAAWLTIDQCTITKWNSGKYRAKICQGKNRKRKLIQRNTWQEGQEIMSSESSASKKIRKIWKKIKSQRRAFNKCKDSNPDHIRELDGLAFAKSGKSNPQRVQGVKKNAKNRKRSFMSGWTHVKASH